jgi:hypothetical protein
LSLRFAAVFLLSLRCTAASLFVATLRWRDGPAAKEVIF